MKYLARASSCWAAKIVVVSQRDQIRVERLGVGLHHLRRVALRVYRDEHAVQLVAFWHQEFLASASSAIVVEQSNFHDFPAARINDAPVVNVHIVPRNDPPKGTSEQGLPPFAPALANALRRATGKPLREMPFNLA